MMAFGWYSLRHAAGFTPPPSLAPGSAAPRRGGPEAGYRHADPSPAEVVRMRQTLTRILHVGDRLAGQALSWRWRDAIGRERRVLTVAVSIAVLVPFAFGSLATVRVAHGDDRTFPVLWDIYLTGVESVAAAGGRPFSMAGSPLDAPGSAGDPSPTLPVPGAASCRRGGPGSGPDHARRLAPAHGRRPGRGCVSCAG